MYKKPATGQPAAKAENVAAYCFVIFAMIYGAHRDAHFKCFK